MILDTDFLIALDEGMPSATEKAREIERRGYPRRVPEIVVYELWVAVGKETRTAHRRQKYEQLLNGLPRVTLTAAIAKRAGKIEGEAQATDPNGSGIGAADAIAAATALETDEPVVTDDRRDFVNRIQDTLGYSDLRVELYT